MFDLGDELTLESYEIPWLIWIQLIVFFLLLLVLFCFALFPLDPADDPADDPAAAAPAAASTSTDGFQLIFHDIQQIENDKPLAKLDSMSTVVTARRRHAQGGENLSIKGEIATSASLRREEITEEESSSLFFLHPCHYFQLARESFLKCFGLDSSSDSPPTRCRKRKES